MASPTSPCWDEKPQQAPKEDHILGLTNVSFEEYRICSAYQAGKQVGIPNPSKSIITTVKPLELLHMDLFGLVAYMSIGGKKYGLVICGRINLNYTGSSTRVHFRGLQRASNSIIPWPVG
jgi:hypothetical protein